MYLIEQGAEPTKKLNIRRIYSSLSEEKKESKDQFLAEIRKKRNEYKLRKAIKEGNLKEVKKYVEPGRFTRSKLTDVNAVDSEGKSMLSYAVGNAEITNYLIAHGAIEQSTIQASSQGQAAGAADSKVATTAPTPAQARAAPAPTMAQAAPAPTSAAPATAQEAPATAQEAPAPTQTQAAPARQTTPPTAAATAISADEINNKLRTAIIDNNLENVKALLANGADLDAIDTEQIQEDINKKPMLALAIEKGNVEIVNALLEQNPRLSKQVFIELCSDNVNLSTESFSQNSEAAHVYSTLIQANKLTDNKLKAELKNVLLNPELDYKESIVHASVVALRAGNKELAHKIDNLRSNDFNQNLDLDLEIRSHSPEYIALKFKDDRTVDFNKLITQCSAESANIILKAAEKQKMMESSPPSKWKKLLIEFSDFCKNRGKNVGIEKMRDILERNSNHISFAPRKADLSGQQTYRR